MPATLSGLPVLRARIARPIVGPWHVRGEATAVEGTELTEGQGATLTIEGVPFTGTILRVGTIAGRVKFRIVGGKGQFAKKLEAKNYGAGPSVQHILDDILRETGDTLAAAVDPSLLTKALPTWERASGPASRALVDLLDAIGSIWRVLPDGTLWLGPEAFASTDVQHVLIDEDFAAGRIDLAPAAPDLTPPLASLGPGVTLLGQQIRYVVHELDGEKLRSSAYLEAPGQLLDRYLAGIRREIAFSRLFPAVVTGQNEDGSLQVVPDDDTIKGSGLDRVRIRLGVPGSVTVPNGARVRVGFESGDRSKAFAIGFDGAALTELKLGAGSDFVSLAAKCDARHSASEDRLSAIEAALNTPHAHPGVLTGGGTSGPMTLSVSPGSPGTSVAATKVKAE